MNAPGRAGNIDLGICSPAEDLAKAARSGFDYLEPPGAVIAAMTDAAFESFRQQ